MKPMDARMRMVMVWAVSLFACLMPHPLLGDRWQQLFHQPLFLLIVPVALACLSLLVPVRTPMSEEEEEDRLERKRKASGWQVLLILSSLLTVFFGWCLVDACRDTSVQQAERVRDCLEFFGLTVLPLLGVWVALLKLKRLGHLWY
ncbi:hypothetical protein [Edaphobacter acidisoli]|uniref:hypothetical protein n=1 Tax=Edaphobacter acidisoli TaxID=2040573 RepID=UPI0016686B97|nr:hypothetical protein [Edaphobacter acidisoli]